MVAFLMAVVDGEVLMGAFAVMDGRPGQVSPGRGACMNRCSVIFQGLPMSSCKSTVKSINMSCCIDCALAHNILPTLNAAQDKPLSPTLPALSLANRP